LPTSEPPSRAAEPTPPIHAERAPPPEPATLASEPIHVSEEPELVEEFAEPGAEEGAGAEVRVAEPWSGYHGMTAKQVIARVADATLAELAAVQLYESANRHRATVLSAVDREFRNRGRTTSSET
jgi:hypothetical protein